MAGEVRIEQADKFRTFADDVTRLRDNFTRMGRPHTVLPAGPPEVSAELGLLTDANAGALTRLSGFTTAADRGMAGLAFVSAWIGTNFPATEGRSAQRMAGLVAAATAEIPPPPADLPSIDPRFVPAPAEQ